MRSASHGLLHNVRLNSATFGAIAAAAKAAAGQCSSSDKTFQQQQSVTFQCNVGDHQPYPACSVVITISCARQEGMQERQQGQLQPASLCQLLPVVLYKYACRVLLHVLLNCLYCFMHCFMYCITTVSEAPAAASKRVCR